MLKKALVLLVCALFISTADAQDKRVQKLQLADDATSVNNFSVLSANPASFIPASWVVADTMPNCFGTGSSKVAPLQYDPYSKTLVFITRGAASYSPGQSGQMFYTYSTDWGTTWNRVLPGINSGLPQRQGRYPDAKIHNSDKGDISVTTGLFTWPELVGGAFGGAGFGADQPLGNGAFAAGLDEGPGYTSNIVSWASDTEFYLGWWSGLVGYNKNDGPKIWRTADFATIDTSTIVGPDGYFWWYTVGSEVSDGVTYLFSQCAVNDSTLLTPPGGTLSADIKYYSYWKSTNNGDVWTGPTVFDYRTINLFRDYDAEWQPGTNTLSYSADAMVDAAGKVHYITAITDLNATPVRNTLVEIFETPNGIDGKIIFDNMSDSAWKNNISTGPALNQMGANPKLSMNKERNLLVATWTHPTTSDGKNNDIWYSYRTADGEWTAPVNVTNSPNMNENSFQTASMLEYDPATNEYILFVGYTYINADRPYETTDQTVPNFYYFKAVRFASPVSVENESNPDNFVLFQNYPNPFNPSTSINYAINERANVTLKVYDMLGSEVASLVNEVKDAGSYSINFDASKLSSGTYIYKLAVGNKVQTKKMMLLK
jgi:hypothetical protein